MEKIKKNITFSKARELYDQQEYDQLINLFLKSKKEMSKNVFHYNLGTLYLHKKNYPVSHFHFDKAYQNGMDHSYLKKNFFLSKHLVDTRSETVSLFDKSFFYMIDNSPYLFYFFMMLFLFVSLFTKMICPQIKKIQNFFLAGLLFTILLFQFYIKEYRSSVVLEMSSIREGPSRIFGKKYDIMAGKKVYVSTRHDGYYYIDFPQSFRGWISRKKLAF